MDGWMDEGEMNAYNSKHILTIFTLTSAGDKSMGRRYRS